MPRANISCSTVSGINVLPPMRTRRILPSLAYFQIVAGETPSWVAASSIAWARFVEVGGLPDSNRTCASLAPFAKGAANLSVDVVIRSTFLLSVIH